jgi:type II secretory pathway predicted ATPase ExeA
MYLEYWGLREKPFENIADPRFFYRSLMHTEGLRRLQYGLYEQKGCTLLTGEYGSGKTFLVTAVIEALDPAQNNVALINYPVFAPQEFLKEVLFQFGQEGAKGTRLELFQQLSNYAFENLKAGKRNLLLVDEAQLITDPEVFEELRLLLNLQFQGAFLISIFLIGQSELRERIMEYPHLEQRIGIKYHLHQFDQEDTTNYVRHRLKIAGLTQEVFTPEALRLIYKMSHGVARRINNLGDLSLMEGFNAGAKIIDEKITQRII